MQKFCVRDVIKNINIKVFNLMSRTVETRYTEQHETCKCKCRLDASVCNNIQRWNNDKCRCECKELVDKGTCYKGFIWNSSSCEYECNKSFDVGYYENCKYRKRLIEQLVEECSEKIDEVKAAKITLAEDENKHKNKWSSCTLYIVLFSIVSIINIGICAYFVYFHWHLKKRCYSC